MVYLQTLEGVAADQDYILDQLFDCNDVMGVMIFGVDNWNKVKANVADTAAKIIARNRGSIGRFDRRGYVPTNDIMDRAFGFNDEVGLQLMNGSDWRRFKNTAKTSAPVLGSLADMFNPVKQFEYAKKALVPDDFTDPWAWIKYLTGVQQAEGAVKQMADYTGYTEKKEAEAEKKRQQEADEKEAERIANQQELDRQYEQTLKELELEQQRIANKTLETQLKSDPTYQSAQTSNLFIIGGLALAAVVLLSRKK